MPRSGWTNLSVGCFKMGCRFGAAIPPGFMKLVLLGAPFNSPILEVQYLCWAKNLVELKVKNDVVRSLGWHKSLISRATKRRITCVALINFRKRQCPIEPPISTYHFTLGPCLYFQTYNQTQSCIIPRIFVQSLNSYNSC